MDQHDDKARFCNEFAENLSLINQDMDDMRSLVHNMETSIEKMKESTSLTAKEAGEMHTHIERISALNKEMHIKMLEYIETMDEYGKQKNS